MNAGRFHPTNFYSSIYIFLTRKKICKLFFFLSITFRYNLLFPFIIQGDCKRNAQFTMVPLKMLPDQEWIRYPYFSFNLHIFICGFSTIMSCKCRASKKEFGDILGNSKLTTTCLIILRFQGIKGTGVNWTLLSWHAGRDSYTVSKT